MYKRYPDDAEIIGRLVFVFVVIVVLLTMLCCKGCFANPNTTTVSDEELYVWPDGGYLDIIDSNETFFVKISQDVEIITIESTGEGEWDKAKEIRIKRSYIKKIRKTRDEYIIEMKDY